MGFPKMQEIVPEGAKGVAKIEHFEVSKSDSAFTAFRPGEYVPPGKYARLKIKGGVMMSDTRMEHITNYTALNRATGDVLIGGLGIGMLLLPVLQKPEVKSVTVVELYQEVIDLVEPAIRKAAGSDSVKLTVVRDDVLTWRPTKGVTFDTIYFDIWQDISTDNLKEIATLKRAFARRLRRDNPRSWMGAWVEDQLRSAQRRSRRDEQEYGYLRSAFGR